MQQKGINNAAEMRHNNSKSEAKRMLRAGYLQARAPAVLPLGGTEVRTRVVEKAVCISYTPACFSRNDCRTFSAVMGSDVMRTPTAS